MPLDKLSELKRRLRPGSVYRRSQLAKWTKSVDRHAAKLVQQGVLKKLRYGVYACLKQGTFGAVPPTDAALVRVFLNDDRFLLVSPNAYNALGLGTTQLSNLVVVYNHKRHGRFQLGGKTFQFRCVSFPLPKRLSEEFLLVELMGHPEYVAEERQTAFENLRKKLANYPKASALKKAVKGYGNVTSQRYFEKLNGLPS